MGTEKEVISSDVCTEESHSTPAFRGWINILWHKSSNWLLTVKVCYTVITLPLLAGQAVPSVEIHYFITILNYPDLNHQPHLMA